MADQARITLAQLQQAAARAGITVGDEAEMLLPLIDQIQAALDALPDARLRGVEPLLVHNTHRRKS